MMLGLWLANSGHVVLGKTIGICFGLALIVVALVGFAISIDEHFYPPE